MPCFNGMNCSRMSCRLGFNSLSQFNGLFKKLMLLATLDNNVGRYHCPKSIWFQITAKNTFLKILGDASTFN